MGLKLTPGDVEDFKKSSTDRVTLTIVKKDFTGKLIQGIKLENSFIAKSVFREAKIYASEFTNCEFTKDSFMEASMMGVDFKGCTFFSCNFSKCNLSHVVFDENCKFYESIFTEIEMSDDVMGLDPKDQKIITEQDDPFATAFKAAGFEDLGDESYEFKIGQYIKAVAYFDTEVKLWRITYFANEQSLYTVDLYKGDEANIMGKMKQHLNTLKNMLSNKERFDDMEGEIAEIEAFLSK